MQERKKANKLLFIVLCREQICKPWSYWRFFSKKMLSSSL